MAPMDDSQQPLEFNPALIDRATRPRFFRALEERDGYARRIGDCGDVVEFMIRRDGDRAAEVTFQTIGCMAMIASCDVAAEMASGRLLAEVDAITPDAVIDRLGGVPPEKVHCTELAVATLREAAAATAEER